MNRHQSMSMIVCQKYGMLCYYSPGIQLINIPFQHSEIIALHKITWRGKFAFRKNFLGAFLRFQQAWKIWFKKAKSLKRLLQRQIGLVEPLLFQQIHQQICKPACMPSVVERGL